MPSCRWKPACSRDLSRRVGLYAREGFTECPPFGSYRADPHSVFMTLML